MSNHSNETSERTYSQKIALLPKMQFTHVLGGFRNELENEFLDAYFRNSLGLVRVTLILSALLVASFGILDIWILPITKTSAWIIRYAVIIPIAAICLVLSFTPLFRKVMQGVLCLLVLSGGIGFSVMLAFAQTSEQGFLLYYVGIIQVLIAGYTLLRIRFIFISLTGIVILVFYEIVSIFYNGMIADQELIPIFLNNNFFLISTNIMGMIAGYFTEFYLRNTFLLRKRIQFEEEHIIENTRSELNKTKKELDQTQTTLQSLEEQADVGLRSIFNTIKNKHAIQQDLNKNAAKSLLMVRNSGNELDTRVNKVLKKSFEHILDRYEKVIVHKLDKHTADKLIQGIENEKKKIIHTFEKQNFSTIEHYISHKIKEHSKDSIDTLDRAFKNMTDLIQYIHAIIAYQRGEKIDTEQHVISSLERVFFTLQYTYKKELNDHNIKFNFINHSDSSVLLPIYDFILEEDIMRNLFLNSFRAHLQKDPQNIGTDKRIWIEVFEERKQGVGEIFNIHFGDNGIGIPADKKEAIFNGFSTNLGQDKDRGIGCMVVRNRVEKMGGTIIETGSFGEGADFIISIPKPKKKQVADTSFELAGRTLTSAEPVNETITI